MISIYLSPKLMRKVFRNDSLCNFLHNLDMIALSNRLINPNNAHRIYPVRIRRGLKGTKQCFLEIGKKGSELVSIPYSNYSQARYEANELNTIIKKVLNSAL